MLIELITLIVISLLLGSLAAPHFIKIALKRFFSTVQMTIYSPVSMRGITLNGEVGLWGLEHLTIYISSIQLGFVPKRLKLRLTITNFQIFGTRKLISFIPVNLIDGFQQPNILFNFLNYICTRPFPNKAQQKQSQKLNPQKKQSSTIYYFFEGIFHLIMLIFFHVVQVNMVDFKAFVVSGLPKDMISFQDKQKHKNSLMLMQCLAQYSLYCDIISAQTNIQQHKNYELMFKCNEIVCTSYLHWKNTFIEVKQIKLNIKIPFSLSLSRSLEELDLVLSIKEGHLNLIPTDFDHFFEFLKQMTFDPFRKTPSKQNQQKGKHNFEIYIDLIKIQFQDIQQYRDNQEAKEYLSNLNNAVITLQHLAQEQNCFSVKMSTFTLTKFYRQHTLSHIMEVLRIPQLCIKTISEASLTEISHQSIILDCHNEQIAFLGKIFSIINTRIKFENYSEDIYKNLVNNYIYGGTIISEMEKILDLQDNLKVDLDEIQNLKKSKIVYLPKKIQIILQMKKLRHIITIQNFSYTRYNRFRQMSHQIVIDKFVVQYKELHEFIVTDFRLTYSLTNKQNQLTMMIQDITMNQNQETLIDYLDSFTLFKQLLQFQSGEADTKKVNKLSKKSIIIYKIALNLGKQAVKIKCLQIQKETHVKSLLNNLYFSLNQGSISLSRLRPTKKYFRPYINTSATIFNFSSFSIKEIFELRNNKQKSKVTIILQDPCFTLPEVKIAYRAFEYIQMFKKLSSHIKAYIQNVSNQKLQYIRHHEKSFLEQPPILCIIVTKLKIAIVDNKLNNTILGFSKTVREELSKKKQYNEAKIISILKRNNSKTYLLYDMQIQKIKIQLNPIRELQSNELSIQKWINNFTNVQKRYEQQYRIKRVKAGNLLFKLKNIKVKIRDYPQPIISISQINFDGSLMSVGRVTGLKSYFIQGCLRLTQIDIHIGLNQLSGFNQVKNRINEFNTVVQQENKKKSMTIKETKSFVHNILQNCKWKISVQKNEKTKVNIYTGNNPYDPQKFELMIGKFITQSHHQQTQVKLQSLKLYYKNFLITHLPDINIQFFLFTIDNEFALDVITKVSSQASINLSSSLIKYVLSLGQLHTDWLLIYGIYEPTVQNKEIHLDNIESMNYIQIMNILVSDKSKTEGRRSLLSLIKRIKITGYFESLEISLIQNDLKLSLKTAGVCPFMVLQPDHELYNRLQIIRSKINIDKVKSYFHKLSAVQNDTIVQQMNVQSTKQYNFVTCENITVNFNWYFPEKQLYNGRANVWIGVGNIHGEFSKRMQRYFIKMIKMFENKSNNKTIISPQQKVHKHKKPLRTFRKAVYTVILINRRNRTKNRMIKKYKVVTQFFSYQMTLYHEDKSMILQSRNKAQFLLSTSYDEEDSFHSHPREQISLLFPESKLYIKEDQISCTNYEIMKTGIFKVIIYNPHQDDDIEFVKVGFCQLRDINVSLNPQNQNFLIEFINFIISLVNTSEVIKKKNQQIMQKYQQLKKMKRQPLKDKIQWKHNDIKLNERKIFSWHFVFRDLSLTLSNEKGPFLYSNIGITDVKINIFNNTKVDSSITISDFIVNNQLQTQHGEFYNILIMPPQSSGLKFKIQAFEVQAFSQITWRYFNEINVHIEPIKIKMTQELLNCIQNFLVKPGEDVQEEVYDKISEYSLKIPDYIRLLNIDSMSFQLWLKSSSMLKRMEGIRVKLDEYTLKNKLYTKRDLMMAFSLWLLKQMGSQVISVLGQKVFGGSEN